MANSPDPENPIVYVKLDRYGWHHFWSRNQFIKIRNPIHKDDVLDVEYNGKPFVIRPDARSVETLTGSEALHVMRAVRLVPIARPPGPLPEDVGAVLKPPKDGLVNPSLSKGAELSANEAIRMGARSRPASTKVDAIWKRFEDKYRFKMEDLSKNPKLARQALLGISPGADASKREIWADRTLKAWEKVRFFRVRQNRWSEELGLIGARDVAKSLGHTELITDPPFRDQKLWGRIFRPRGAGSLDYVTIAPDGTLHIWEVKGGQPGEVKNDLGTREVPDPSNPSNDLTVEQMSRYHARFTMQRDFEFNEALRRVNPKLAEDIKMGRAKVFGHVVKLDTNKKLQHYEVDLGDQTGWLMPGLDLPTRYLPRDRRSGNSGARLAMIAALASAAMAAGMVTGSGPADASTIGGVGDLGANASDSSSYISVLISTSTTIVADLWAKFTSAINESTGLHKAIVDAWHSDSVQKLCSIVERASGLLAAVGIAIQLWAIGQQVLNVVMRSNPLGAIVTAIGLAIEGIVLIVDNWDTIKAAVENLYSTILLPLGRWFGEIWRDTIAPMFQSCVNGIVGFFSGIVDSLRSAWDGILDGIKGLFRRAADFAEKWIPFVGDDAARLIRRFTDPEKKADGGLLQGPGGPRDDLIPLMASHGEFIVNAAATARNLPLLEAVNSGAVLRFADGGVVEVPVGEGFAWAGADGVAGPVGVGENAGDSARRKSGGGRSRRSRSGRAGDVGFEVEVGGSSGSLADYVLEASTARVFLDRVASGASWDGLDSVGASSTSDRARGYAQRGLVGGAGAEAAEFPARRFLAAGGFAGSAAGSGGGFADASSSLLQLISRDADAVAGLNGQQVVPAAAIPGAGRRARNTNRSLAIKISAPSVDGQFLQDKAQAGQRALSYAGRWS